VVTTVIIVTPDVEAVPGSSLPVATEEDHGCLATRRGAMSEQPNVPVQPGSDDEPPTTSTETDAGQHGVVRTQGETAVDDAMGTGDNVH
jgi:hypothetical protein